MMNDKPPIFPNKSQDGVPILQRTTSEGSNHSNRPRPSTSKRRSSLNMDERAEKGLLTSIENKRSHVRTASGESWHSSVDGERPPLGGHVPFEKMYSVMSNDGASHASSDNSSDRSKFQDIARKVRKMSHDSGGSAAAAARHRRTTSRAHVLLESIQEDNDESIDITRKNTTETPSGGIFDGVGIQSSVQGESILSADTTDTDRLVTGAMEIEKLFDKDEDTESVTSVEAFQDEILMTDTSDSETLPLNSSSDSYGSTKSPRWSRIVKKRKEKRRWNRFKHRISQCCNPVAILQAIWCGIMQSYFFTLSLPAFGISWVLFYCLGNPTLDFIPGHASMSWWLNFFGRQCITLEIARIVQWIVVDKIVLGTRTAVRLLGPLMTLYAIQARGYPFLCFAWGLTNLFLLHGSNKFQQHWLFFTDLDIYKDGNSGSYIIESTTYLRMLLSLMLLGVATAAKRTAVAMYFGRRTFTEFKPRLEKILKDIVLLSELAELAEEASRIASAATTGDLEVDLERRGKVRFLEDVNWASEKQLDRNSIGPNLSQDDDDDDDESLSDEGSTEFGPGALPESVLTTDGSGKLIVKELLEYWEEPVNKLDKSLNASINDILKFRRALTFMDDEQPFGESFGRASSRDDVISSAHSVYHMLLKMTPGRDMLSCEVFDMLAENDDGVTINRAKRKAFRKLFRPDANYELSTLAFIQSCDSLYKRLRFFRASVGNASVIDHALESIIDGVFNFVLALTLMSVMRFNPWPLLVSISTLLVSVSFAVGSSASKYIEGMLLIAVTRPYDLGDRIYLMDPSVRDSDNGLFTSWFIEDINLFNTTIRYAGSNEVATINNGAISNMRIVNANRSPNAMVWFLMPFHISASENNMEKMEQLKVALDAYAKNHPRSWHSFAYCRLDEIHVEQEKVIATIGFQHRSNWQDLGGILIDKADLVIYTYEQGKKLGIEYDILPNRELLYYAGVLKDGRAHDYRKSLHDPENIKSHSEDVELDVSRPHDYRKILHNPDNIKNHSEDFELDVSNSNQSTANAMFLAQLQGSHG